MADGIGDGTVDVLLDDVKLLKELYHHYKEFTMPEPPSSVGGD